MTTELKTINAIDDKEKVSFLIELCKIQMNHFDKTRDIEFKVNLALWSLIAIAGKLSLDNFDINLFDLSAITRAFQFIFILVSSGHALWMMMIEQSEINDLKFNSLYKLEILRIMKMKHLRQFEQVYFGHLRGNNNYIGWLTIEVLITMFMILGVFLILAVK